MVCEDVKLTCKDFFLPIEQKCIDSQRVNAWAEDPSGMASACCTQSSYSCQFSTGLKWRQNVVVERAC